MKNFTLAVILSITALFSYAQTPCQNGFAGSYPCDGYDLMSRVSLQQMSASAGNDSWGWTDPANGDEYAIIGLNNGTAFINISDPVNPVYLGKLPTATGNSPWRDIKVYNNHAFIVSEASGHGLQVFDLTRLRNVSNPPQTFNADTRYTEFGNAHNIVINEDSGFAYIVGAQRGGPFRGGPLFIDIREPKNPKNAGGFLSGGQRAYTHDAQVVTYSGPDSDYTGREILIGSNEIEVVIADITDKANPITISTIKYPDVEYTHQGWFTEDSRYFLLGDEIDEQRVGFNTRTIVFDFLDLDNPKQHMIYNGPTPAVDHNGYVKGNIFYLANYRAGIRMIDISNIGSKTMTEVGYFDTFASSDSASFNGVWNVYPYFNSGNILISDIEGGFFLIRKSEPTACEPIVPDSLATGSITSTSATLRWNRVGGAAFDLRYRPTTGSRTWTTIEVAATSRILNDLIPSTTYEAQVRSKCPDGATSDYTNSITFQTAAVSYCESNGDDVSDEFISNVSLGAIDNTSGASASGYTDYTSISTNLTKGQEVSISITPEWTGTVYDEGYAVWIDFNQDGDFTDSEERVWTQSITKDASVSGSFTVPESAASGSTRMRVSMKYNDIPDSCESFQYGEVEDYTVNITTNGGSGQNSCTTGISSFPYSEGFENGLGSWSQFENDDIDWSSNTGGTPSRNTGPDAAAQGSGYLYVEASGQNVGYPNKRAILNSPCFNLTGISDAVFSFEYHMNGASDMGSIALEISTDNGSSWTSLWQLTGSQGNSWETQTVDLSSFAGNNIQLRFNRLTGATWQADIAIDDVTVRSESAKSIEIASSPKEFSLELYPVPVEGSTLYVSISSKEISKYEIRNMLGQLVSQGDVTNSVDVSGLETGTYFLQIAYKGKTFVKRFVRK